MRGMVGVGVSLVAMNLILGGALIADRTGLLLVPDYWIDPVNGNDSGDGSKGSPWLSLSKIDNSIILTDTTTTVRMKAGDYDTVNDIITYTAAVSNATLNLVFEPGCVIDGTAYTAANSTGSAFSPNGSGSHCNLFGNRLIIRNFTLGTGNGLGGTSGTDAGLSYTAYDVEVTNCVDGLSCHGDIKATFDRVWTHDCLKSEVAHIGTSKTYHRQCKFEEVSGGGTGNFITLTSTSDCEFIDCEFVPEGTSSAMGLGTLMDYCRIGTLSRRVSSTGSASGYSQRVLRRSFVNISTDAATHEMLFDRCYGKHACRTRNGGAGYTMRNNILVDPDVNNIFFSNYNPGAATKIDAKDNIFETASAAAFMSVDATNSGYLVSAGAEFHHNVLSGSAAFDADLIAADTLGNVIQDNVTGDALIGSADSYDPDDYAYAAGSPAIGAGETGGNAGFGVGEVVAPNLGFFTDEITDGAGTPVAITTSIAARQVFQRGRATVSLTGTYSTNGGDPNQMMWRVGFGPWVAFTNQVIGSGSWSGTLDIPSNYLAQGTLEVKPWNGQNVTPAQVSNITVTDVFVVNGQSNADGDATNNQSFTKVNYDWLVKSNGGAWTVKTADPTWNSGGSFWPAFAELLDDAGIPPAFVNGATLDATGFAGNEWNPGDSAYNTALGRLNTELALTGGCLLEFWIQGEADSTDNMSENDYFNAMVARRDGFDAGIANFDSSTPTLVVQLGQHGGSGIDNIRAANVRLRAGEDSRFKPGMQLLMEQWGDGTHYGTVQGNVDAAEAEAQLDRVADQAYRAAYSNANAPTVVSAAVSATDAKKVLITFSQALENHAGNFGHDIADGGGSVAITSTAQGPLDTQVELTAIRDLYDPVTYDWGKGGAAQAQIEDINSVLRQATAISGVKLSPEPKIGLAAGTAIGSPPSNVFPDNGQFTSNLNGYNQTGTTWQWSSAHGGSADIDVARGGGGAVFLNVDDISALVAGETYDVGLDIKQRDAGAVFIRIIGDTTVDSPSWNTVADGHTAQVVCPANPTQLRIAGNSVANMQIDNVICQQA